MSEQGDHDGITGIPCPRCGRGIFKAGGKLLDAQALWLSPAMRLEADVYRADGEYARGSFDEVGEGPFFRPHLVVCGKQMSGIGTIRDA